MKNLIAIALIVILSISCNRTADNGNIANNNDIPNHNIALGFINDYVDNCNKLNKSIEITKWVKSNPNTSDKFKNELVKIVDNAHKEDPELGLDFDPIFDTQDYPEDGFKINSVDAKTGYVIVQGKSSDDFKLTMKLIKKNDKWLVDGCGIINIPEDKRIKR